MTAIRRLTCQSFPRVAALMLCSALIGCNDKPAEENLGTATTAETPALTGDTAKQSRPTAPKPMDLASLTLYFEDLKTCKIIESGSQAIDPRLEDRRPLRLPDGRFLVAQVEEPASNESGVEAKLLAIDFEKEVYWNQLPLRRFTGELVERGTSDRSDTRRLHFDVTPAEVQKKLTERGVDVPFDPEFLRLSAGSSRACGGTMMIEEENGKGVLACSWGC